MVHFKYAPFLSIVIHHNFYFDSISKDFVFTALPETEQILKALGLIARFIDGSLVVYQQRDKNNIPTEEIDEPVDLFFPIRVGTDLLNITQNFGKAKYWFSNLKPDGSYKTVLTEGELLGLEDELPDIVGQTINIDFIPGTVKKIVVKRNVGGSGFREIISFEINAQSTFQQIRMSKPGFYLIEKQMSSGNVEQTRLVMHDELLASGSFWSLAHLQIRPGEEDRNYNIVLKPKETLWQYLLVEPKDRVGGPINVNAVKFEYSRPPASRYPPDVVINLKSPATYSDNLKNFIQAIKLSDQVRDVFVFESESGIEIMDGVPPLIKVNQIINNQETVLATQIDLPQRSMKQTQIIYNL